MSAEAPKNEPGSQRAEAAFAEYLRRREAGEDLDFKAYCAERAELAAALRALHSLHEARLAADSTVGFSAWLEGLDSGAGAARDEVSAEREAAGENAAPPSGPSPSSRPRYAVRGEVARGGMGAILKVWDADLRRTLAMKVMLARGESETADAQQLARFLEEAQITGQLDHPGVVPVHDMGVDSQGRVFFTMRLVKGKDLREVLGLVKDGKEGWTQTRALGVLVKVCEALGYAHAKGVIHRDVKPPNIMVGRFGETYVMDWGLAKVLGKKDTRDLRLRTEPSSSYSAVRTERSDAAAEDLDSPLVTMDGTVVGTPSYMSPEQADGRIDELDRRSDVYAVGAILYELLTGEMPYVRRGARITPRTILARVVEGPPARVEELNPNVPAELVAICERAMARDKAARYPSTKEMAEDLQAYLENRVVRAYRTGAAAELKKWVVRNKGVAGALGVLVLSIAVGMMASLVLLDRVNDERIAKGQALDKEKAALGENKALLAQKTAALSEKDAALTRAEGLRLAAHSTAVLPSNPSLALLLAIEGAKRAPEMLANNALRDALSELRELTTLVGHRSGVSSAHFSANGQRVVTASADRTARIWEVETGKALHVLRGHEDWVESAQFSANGQRVVTASGDGTARIWEVETGKELHVLRGHEGSVQSAQFSANGQRVVTASRDDRTARIWEVETGKALHVLRGHEPGVESAQFSADGQRVVTVSDDFTARIWEVETGEALHVLEGHRGSVQSAQFSVNGQRVVTASLDGTARIWEVETGKALHVLRGHEHGVESAQFSANGQRVVTASEDRTARIWEVETGKELHVLRGHEGSVQSAQFSANGQRVVTASFYGPARIWEVETGKELHVLRGHEDWVESAQFSANGQRVVTASLDGTARIWEVETGEELHVLRGHEGSVQSAQFSANGQRVVTASLDGTARIWEVATGEALHVLRGHEGSVESAQFSVNGERVVTASVDGTARIWEVETGKELHVLRGHEGLVLSAQFSVNGQRVVTASADRTARIWEVKTGKALHVLRGHEDWVQSAQFSANGQRVVTASRDGTARIREVETGEALHVLRGYEGSVQSAQFSANAQRVVTASADRTARIWEVETGKELHVLRGHEDWVRSAQFSANVQRVVTASDDGTARIWEVETGKELHVFRGHESLVDFAQFSANGRRVVTASRDHTARIWEVETGKALHVLRGHEDGVESAQFSANGERVVTASLDRTARIWEVDVLPAALRHKPRELTPEEVERFEIGSPEERAKYRRTWEISLLSRDIVGMVRLLSAGSTARALWVNVLSDLKELVRLGKEVQDEASFEQASDYAREAVEATRGEPWFLALLAEIQATRGDFPLAIGILERVLRHPHAEVAHAKALDEYRAKLIPDLATFASIDASIDAREVLLPKGAEWRYFPGKREPSAGLEWMMPGFGDSEWQEGASGFGYGEEGLATALSDMQGEYTTLYLRRELAIDDSGSLQRLALSVQVDDGFVAYWNGNEIGRYLAGEAEARMRFDSVATGNASEPPPAIEISVSLDSIVRGVNVLAIQGLNRAKDSSDFVLTPRVLGEHAPDIARDRKRFAAFRAAARGDDAPARLAYFEARILQRSGKHREALVELEKATAMAKRRPEPVLRLAESLRALGEPAAAEGRVRAALEAGIEDDDVLWDLWFEIAAVDLKRDAAALLGALPALPREGTSPRREDLRWLLTELATTNAVRMRAGGEDYVDSANNLWARDRFFTAGFRYFGDIAGGATEPFTGEIAATDDDPLYQTERWFPPGTILPPGYHIPLPVGAYRVTLHFAEIFPGRQTGARNFDVRVEGKAALENYDPQKGGFATAVKEPVETTVDDGFLDLEIVRREGDPKISAIEIEPHKG